MQAAIANEICKKNKERERIDNKKKKGQGRNEFIRDSNILKWGKIVKSYLFKN